MLELTPSAHEQIAEYFKNQEVEPIRVFLNSGGCCGGPSLALALDETKETDNVYEKDGFTFLIDKEFMEKAQPIKIDFNEFGFKITSAMKFEDVESSCGCGCGSGGSESGGSGSACDTKGSCCC